jgi:small subunit ribosomal protein S2
LLFVIDPKREYIAVREASRLGIPVVALCDTNCDPDRIAHVIPGNDDAIKSIELFTGAIAEACIEGNAASRGAVMGDKIVAPADVGDVEIYRRSIAEDAGSEGAEADVSGGDDEGEEN